MRKGKKSAFRGPDLVTVLLQNIVCVSNGETVTDHLWFNETKGFQSLGDIKEGCLIEFLARVTPYEKGYKGRREDVYVPIELDYKLSRPTQIKLIDLPSRKEEPCE